MIVIRGKPLVEDVVDRGKHRKDCSGPGCFGGRCASSGPCGEICRCLVRACVALRVYLCRLAAFVGVFALPVIGSLRSVYRDTHRSTYRIGRHIFTFSLLSIRYCVRTLEGASPLWEEYQGSTKGSNKGSKEERKGSTEGKSSSGSLPSQKM